MKFMKRRGLRLFAVAALLPLMTSTSGAVAQSSPSPTSASVTAADTATTQQVTGLLRDFLAAVPKSDRQVFDNFFADDVIYTRATGVTINKAQIMEGIGSRLANEPVATYEAEDLSVHAYPDMAVVNFRLVQHKDDNGKKETVHYRNTGTFLKRNGKWQVVAWQATRVP